jgi:hypothetical protein
MTTSKSNPNYRALYSKQKHLAKKETLKLQPGTFLEVKWDESPNSVVLLLERPYPLLGELSLKVLIPYEGTRRLAHVQVVRVLGTLEWPQPSTV